MAQDKQSAAMYVKIRGRSHGPLTLDKMRELVRKGQLSRIHHISEDGENWRSAGEFPALFETAQKQAASTSQNSQAASTAPQESKTWYYNFNNESVGPITLSEMHTLVPSGVIKAATMVWREGMESWQPASEVSSFQGLFAGSPEVVDVREKKRSRRSHSKSSGGDGDGVVLLSDSTIDSMRGIAPWTLFLSIMGFVFCGLLVIFGIFLIALDTILIPSGATCILLGGMILTGSLFLIQKSGLTAKSRTTRSIEDLNASFRASGRFWAFVGFSTIAFSIMVVFLVIFFFAAFVEIVQSNFPG